ncbi:DMT family transporter [Peribacillus alkalitolerans]|uniref:DMT family transporter n=1 Tax=Peribacillus alkalitolerans TaxID=1550385 RepID=UPI0013D7B6B6|nr:EamA family transporter [Peribacillus alkalitolerans]
MSKKDYAVYYVIVAAIFWGMIGIFVKGLKEIGFEPMEIVAIRAISTSLILVFFGLLSKRDSLRVTWRSVPFFIGTGILSIVFFNWCYFYSMDKLSISTAVILLYTAPIFVVLLSSIFLNEKLTLKKLALVLLTVVGCGFVTGIDSSGMESNQLIGYLIGLGAGLGYAMYSIFGKFALKKHSSFTVTTYTFIFASIALIPVTKLWEKKSLFLHSDVFFHIFGLCIISTIAAYLFYTAGLNKMESSKASLLSTIEPVAAMGVGLFVFNESLDIFQWIGAILILSAVAIFSIPSKLKVSWESSSL